jgi:large subunit ribosomal protein L3
VTFGKRRASRVSKPAAGHLAKAGVEAGEVLKEFRVTPDELGNFKPGDVVAATIFQVGQKVDVSGTSIGKGFAGAIKRHHFSSNRAATATRCRTTRPARSAWRRIRVACFPASAWPGHLGDVARTTQNLEVVRVDEARQLLLVRGAVPGAGAPT